MYKRKLSQHPTDRLAVLARYTLRAERMNMLIQLPVCIWQVDRLQGATPATRPVPDPDVVWKLLFVG